MDVHLSTRGLSKSYRKGREVVPVLSEVDLELDRGESLAIVGSSGSGKSTLLHLLGLLDAPDAGEIRLEGRRIDDLSGRRRDRLRNGTIALIFQFYHLLPELSAIENVMLPSAIRYGPLAYLGRRKEIRGRAEALLDRVGLSHRRTHTPGELSGGEMQRVAIARALAAEPSVLLADEPTGNLDAGNGREVLEILRDLNREDGLTMILVTHDLQIAGRADRVLRLSEGRMEEWSPVLA